MKWFEKMIVLKRGIRTDSLWTTSFAYRSFLKHIPLFLDTYALMRSQWWPRTVLEEVQDEKLSVLFKQADKVPYWKNVFAMVSRDEAVSSRDILRRIPVTSKSDFTARERDEIVNLVLLKKSDEDHTSGSTGTPFHFYHDWHASLRSYAVTERIFRVKKRYPIVYMRSKERHGFTFYKHHWFFLRGYTGVEHRIDEFRKLGERFKNGFILYGYTSWVIALVRQIEKRGLQLPIRRVMVAGEHVLPEDRLYVEKVLGTELFTFYASREVGFLGFECEHHAMHIAEEWALLEIVDEEGTPLPDGKEGRIVVTVFDNQVMPFIRYALGDVGTISREPCACGRTLRTLIFKGRTVEFIDLGSGRVVSLLDIAYALGMYKDSLRQYQIIQTAPLAFTLKVVPGPQFEMNRELLNTLMVRLLHPTVHLSWDIVASIPESKSGKAIYFIRDFSGT